MLGESAELCFSISRVSSEESRDFTDVSGVFDCVDDRVVVFIFGVSRFRLRLQRHLERCFFFVLFRLVDAFPHAKSA